MSPSAVALAVMSGIVGLGVLVGFLARRHHKMDLEQWTVGGRAFGLVLVWLLMAGEVYTAFTFLGASGWAYSRGGPVLYILGEAYLIYVVSFFILPLIWEAGQKHRLQTQADFFQVRYGNTYLSGFVALVGAASLVPYLQLQLTGLGLIVETASFGEVHRIPAMIVGFTLVAAFVFVSGVRGIAFASIVKDFLLLFAAVFIGIAVPRIYFGGIGPMFAAVIRAKPSHLVMPGATKDLGHAWYITTVLLVSLTFYMWPHYFAAGFTARSSKIIRRNAVIMPLYTLTMPLMFFVGLTALLVMPHLENGDLALLAMVRKTFPAWFLGLIGGAGALTAMIPAAIQLLAGATLYAKNLFPIVAPGMTERQVAKVAKVMVLVLASGALVFAIFSSVSLASLFLLGFGGVAQTFPGVVFGLFSRRVTTAAVFAGMIAGLSLTLFLMLTGRDPYHGWNAAFIALCFNFAVTALVSLVTPVRITGFDQTVPAAAAPQ